jgi:hypothetical protein
MLTASVGLTPGATLVMVRRLPGEPTDTEFAWLATEPAPSATEFAPDAVALAPTAEALDPVACAPEPTATLLPELAVELPPIATDSVPVALAALPVEFTATYFGPVAAALFVVVGCESCVTWPPSVLICVSSVVSSVNNWLPLTASVLVAVIAPAAILVSVTAEAAPTPPSVTLVCEALSYCTASPTSEATACS